MTDPRAELGTLIEDFFAAVSFRAGETPGYDRIRPLFVHGGRLIRNSEGRGLISTQFVRTPGGWRISSMAWDDERPGLAIPDRYR